MVADHHNSLNEGPRFSRLGAVRQTCVAVGVTIVLLSIGACESAYYGAWDTLGYHKRDILVERVENAMGAQEEAKEEFASALDKFASVVNVESSGLQDRYEELNDAFERSEDKAEEVTERINAVEGVSEALFEEWEDELEQYTNPKLKSSSERSLRETRVRYEGLMASMRRAEAKIQPVLNAFRDQVLFLKHNLNAQAVSSLKSELTTIESDVADLIREMEVSIRSSQAFIEEMNTGT